jgi:hypothetical protein
MSQRQRSHAIRTGHEDAISPALWHDCMGASFAALTGERHFPFDAVARSREDARRYVEDSAIVRGQVRDARAPPGSTGRRSARRVMAKLLADLRSGIAAQELGPVGRRFGTELIADVELEHGMRGRQPVDVGTLDELFQKGDEATLRHYALRLPDAELRTQAQRRVIRLHIQASQQPQVREHAGAIEQTLLHVGSNPIAISEHRPLRARVDTAALAARGVRVRQDLRRQTSTLLGYAFDGSGISVLPTIALRGALQIELEGIDGPLTVCAPPETLDPTPCVPASVVNVDSRLAHVDADGTLRFIDRLTAGEAAALAASARRWSSRSPAVSNSPRSIGTCSSNPETSSLRRRSGGADRIFTCASSDSRPGASRTSSVAVRSNTVQSSSARR